MRSRYASTRTVCSGTISSLRRLCEENACIPQCQSLSLERVDQGILLFKVHHICGQDDILQAMKLCLRAKVSCASHADKVPKAHHPSLPGQTLPRTCNWNLTCQFFQRTKYMAVNLFPLDSCLHTVCQVKPSCQMHASSINQQANNTFCTCRADFKTATLTQPCLPWSPTLAPCPAQAWSPPEVAGMPTSSPAASCQSKASAWQLPQRTKRRASQFAREWALNEFSNVHGSMKCRMLHMFGSSSRVALSTSCSRSRLMSTKEEVMHAGSGEEPFSA